MEFSLHSYWRWEGFVSKRRYFDLPECAAASTSVEATVGINVLLTFGRKIAVIKPLIGYFLLIELALLKSFFKPLTSLYLAFSRPEHLAQIVVLSIRIGCTAKRHPLG